MADRQGPQVGMIVRGRYLWHEQAVAERDHAPYSRPCLVIAVHQQDKRQVVDVLPFTSKSQNNGRGFELPPEMARRFGMSERESFVNTQEKNVVEWSPRFVEPIRGRDTPVYGHLTPGLTRKAIEQHQEHQHSGTALKVERNHDEQPTRDAEQIREINRQAQARGDMGRNEPEHEH